MRQTFTINLAVLMEEMVNSILHSGEIDTDNDGVWCTLNDELLLVSWVDLMDIRDSPDISKAIKNGIQQFMEEMGVA